MDLLSRWSAVAGDSPAARRRGRELLARWSQPHRHYHSTAHLRNILEALDLLAEEIRTPSTVQLAAWFHDAVYDGNPGDDERASAALAAHVLPTIGFTRAEADEVARLVRLTIGHDPAPDDADGAALCDADLSVLGADPDGYEAYTRAVRLDYAHVPEDTFRRARAAVLAQLLNKESLFHTPTGRALWEGAARRNVGDELRHLRQSTGHDR
ncbi:HD domain-containing protein [Phytoactinopolyspora halophila]|nr:hypothetical protein [Phytoactinopolyspora halophila]